MSGTACGSPRLAGIFSRSANYDENKPASTDKRGESMPFSPFEIRVQPEAIHDGHVNNVQYMAFLEQARQPWYQYFSRLGFRSFVARLQAEYKKEAFLGDVLLIHSSIERVGNTSFVLRQLIRNQRDELVLQAEVTFVAICARTGEKIRVPDELRQQA
ncbi:acyl-CoA thioesterase [Brevibacillus agri]|uniref:acyl-CoA thioesterase n=1 Tax=Brevibacillus agri TaxID=51101 RepID=UPI003D744E1A